MRMPKVILTITILFFSMLSGCIFSSDDNGDDENPKGFAADDLTYPAYNNLASHFQLEPKPDSDENATKNSYRYETSWAFAYNQVFPFMGGVMQVWLTNLGETQMYIYEFGLAPGWEEQNVTRATDKLILPDEEIDLGYISFTGPESGGDYEYELKFGLMVRANATSQWFDWGLIGNKTYTMNVSEQTDSSSFLKYEPINNPRTIYKTVNDLIDPMQQDRYQQC